MIDIVARIAEQKIEEAIRKGELDNLPGAGKPLKLEDDANVPAELRTSFKILKNAGYIPAEMEEIKEIRSLRTLVRTMDDSIERAQTIKELNFKLLRFNMTRNRPLNLEALPEYEDRVLQKISP